MQSKSLVALAVCVLVVGCLSDEEAVKCLRKDHPRQQAAMMARIAREGKGSLAGELIRLLEDEDEGVRFMAAASLHKLTGIDRGFHFAEAEKRQAIVAEWHRWYEAETGEPVPELKQDAPAEEGAEEDEAAEPATDAQASGDAEAPGTAAERDGTGSPDAGPEEFPRPDMKQPGPGTPPEETKETAG